jgi:hypothetical protein
MTRDQWLLEATILLRPRFSDLGRTIPPKLRLACGWPAKRALTRRARTIGECWPPSASADGSVEIFISPALGDPRQVLETLLHELVHAVVGTHCGHRGAFQEVARALGFLPPWRSTPASIHLQQRLNVLLTELAPYPHAPLDYTRVPFKKDGTRLIKIACPACGYLVRTTAKWLSRGLPICPCGTGMTECSRATVPRFALFGKSM